LADQYPQDTGPAISQNNPLPLTLPMNSDNKTSNRTTATSNRAPAMGPMTSNPPPEETDMGQQIEPAMGTGFLLFRIQ
jgi:hypothetical protein